MIPRWIWMLFGGACGLFFARLYAWLGYNPMGWQWWSTIILIAWGRAIMQGRAKKKGDDDGRGEM